MEIKHKKQNVTKNTLEYNIIQLLNTLKQNGYKSDNI